MGTNSITTELDGQTADAADVNQYKDALKGDIVPRNAAGVPAAAAGQVGTLTYPFKDVVVSDSLGDNIKQFSVDGDNVKLKDSSGNILDSFGVKPYTTDGSDPGIGGISMSSSCGTYQSYDTTLTDVTNLSATLTTRGGLVEMSVVPDGSGNVTLLQISRTSTNPILEMFFREGTTTLGYQRIVGTDAGSKQIPASSLRQIVALSAGTHTIKVSHDHIGDFMQIHYARLVLREL